MERLKLLFIFSVLFAFQAVAQEETPSSSMLPIIKITTDGSFSGAAQTVNFSIIENEDAANNLTDAATFKSEVEIESLDEYSETMDTKPELLLSFTDNVELFGMSNEREWVLSGLYADKTMLRTALAYKTIRKIDRYAPRTEFVVLYIDDVYKGLYLLAESPTRDNDRIDIKKVDEEDLSGGYILKMTDDTEVPEGKNGFVCSLSGKTMLVTYPTANDLTTSHLEYIESYVNDFELAVQNEQFTGDDDYKNLIGLGSFTEQYLIAEAFRNVDAFVTNQ